MLIASGELTTKSTGVLVPIDVEAPELWVKVNVAPLPFCRVVRLGAAPLATVIEVSGPLPGGPPVVGSNGPGSTITPGGRPTLPGPPPPGPVAFPSPWVAVTVVEFIAAMAVSLPLPALLAVTTTDRVASVTPHWSPVTRAVTLSRATIGLS